MNDTYSITLENFGGPLEFLLYLIRKNEMDIYDIPIAKITNQYLEYIESFQQLPMEEASEFMAMAATLLAIKAKALVPHTRINEDGEEVIDDPRSGLVAQLLAYRKFKEASLLLKDFQEQNMGRVTRPDDLLEEYMDEEEKLKRPYNTGMDELFRTYLRLIPAIDAAEIRIKRKHVIQQEIPITTFKRWITDLQPVKMSFIDLLEKIYHRTSSKKYDIRKSIVSMLSALLELSKQSKIYMIQEGTDSDDILQPIYIGVDQYTLEDALSGEQQELF